MNIVKYSEINEWQFQGSTIIQKKFLSPPGLATPGPLEAVVANPSQAFNPLHSALPYLGSAGKSTNMAQQWTVAMMQSSLVTGSHNFGVGSSEAIAIITVGSECSRNARSQATDYLASCRQE